MIKCAYCNSFINFVEKKKTNENLELLKKKLIGPEIRTYKKFIYTLIPI